MLLVVSPIISFASTFGNTSVGGSTNYGNLNDALCTIFTSPSDITGKTLDDYKIHLSTNTNGGKLAIWNTSDNVPTSLVSNSITSFSGGSTGWITTNFSGSPSLTNSTVYCLGILPVNSNTKWEYGDGINTFYTGSNNYTTPTTWGTPSGPYNQSQSIYIDYSLASTTTPPTATTTTATAAIISGFTYGETLQILLLLMIFILLFFSTLKTWIFGHRVEGTTKIKSDKNL